MSQPKWKLIAQLGDASPIDYGGYFIYEDETGEHAPQGEWLIADESGNQPESEGPWTVYRFDLDKCTLTSEDDGPGGTYTVLSDNPSHPMHPAWFAKDLASVAETCGESVEDLRKHLCSDNVINRACAYREIGEYHGFDNLDSYPLTFTDRAEVEERYDIESDKDAETKRTISSEGIRQHTLSDRAVKLPDARDHDTQSQYGVRALTGMWVTYRERDAKAEFSHYRSGRILGRVDAPAEGGQYPVEEVKGSLSVLALSDNMQFLFIRWIKPEDVSEVSVNPPAKLLAWLTGPMPKAEIVYKLSHYGTLSERYIDNVAHHITAFEAGVSPSAFDALEMAVTTNQYEVIVGYANEQTETGSKIRAGEQVYSGTSLRAALDHFKEQKDNNKSVTVLKNGEVRWEHKER